MGLARAVGTFSCSGVCIGTLGGAKGEGESGNLGGSRLTGAFGTRTGLMEAAVGDAGAAGGGATACPRMSATFAKALRMGGPKWRGGAAFESSCGFKR